MAKPIVGLFVYYIIMFFFTSLLIAAIFMLLKTISCKGGGTFAFEHFQNDQEKTMRDLAKKLRNKTQEVLDKWESADEESEKEICEVFDYVKTNYIGKRSMPSDDSESSLAPEVQTKRKERREARAEKSFKEKIAQFEKREIKLLECFEVSPAQEDLDDAIKEFQESGIPMGPGSKMSDEIKRNVEKFGKINNTMMFNDKYLDKTIAAVSKVVESSNKEDAEPSTEGFEDTKIRTPEESIQVATYLITLLDQMSLYLANFKKKVKEQKSKLGTINAVQNKVVSGDMLEKGNL